jgi:hypothetical protein
MIRRHRPDAGGRRCTEGKIARRHGAFCVGHRFATDDVEQLVDGLPGAGDARGMVRIGGGMRQKLQPSAMALDKVESVDVNQSIAGRLLNYGDVTIMGVGEGKETIATIASPLAFRNSITAR